MTDKKRGAAYSADELKATAAAYVGFAIAQYTGQRVNKAAVQRELMAGVCAGRSRGSLDAKFMNYSAVAVDHNMLPGLPFGYVKGYKPAPNYQAAMVDALRDAIGHAMAAALAGGFERTLREIANQ